MRLATSTAPCRGADRSHQSRANICRKSSWFAPTRAEPSRAGDMTTKARSTPATKVGAIPRTIKAAPNSYGTHSHRHSAYRPRRYKIIFANFLLQEMGLSAPCMPANISVIPISGWIFGQPVGDPRRLC